MDNLQPQHTDRQYEEELRGLRGDLLEMGGLVEKQIADAIERWSSATTSLARETIERDHTVNRMDVEIDELCIRLLALHQPAAKDLRFITTGLEDHHRPRAHRRHGRQHLRARAGAQPRAAAQALHRHPAHGRRRPNDAAREPRRLRARGRRAGRGSDRRDDEVDQLNGQIFRELLSYMVEDPQTITRAIRLLFIAKYLERIADHATNIAEMVVFMVKGKSIRHMDKKKHE